MTARSSSTDSTRSRPSVQQIAADRVLHPTVRTSGCMAGERTAGVPQAGLSKTQFPYQPVQLGPLHLTDRTRAECGKHRPFRMEVDDPAEGDQQRADDSGAGQPQPERGDGQQRERTARRRAAPRAGRSSASTAPPSMTRTSSGHGCPGRIRRITYRPVCLYQRTSPPLGFRTSPDTSDTDGIICADRPDCSTFELVKRETSSGHVTRATQPGTAGDG